MRLGYAYWGFLADRKIEDGKEVSTPDGNAAYSWSILWEAQRRGWTTYLMQKDRDIECYIRHGKRSFTSFSWKKRYDAYTRSHKTIGFAGKELGFAGGHIAPLREMLAIATKPKRSAKMKRMLSIELVDLIDDFIDSSKGFDFSGIIKKRVLKIDIVALNF